MQVKSCQRRWTAMMGTRGSSPKNYRQNGVMSSHPPHTQPRGGSRPWIIPGRAVWWSLSQTNTARWRCDEDGGKCGETGRVGTEVTGLDKWKELRLAVGHFSQHTVSVWSVKIPLLDLELSPTKSWSTKQLLLSFPNHQKLYWWMLQKGKKSWKTYRTKMSSLV